MDNLQYDLNGNIKSIRRKGPDGDENGYIDDLHYYYKGNFLIAVNDSSDISNGYDFSDNGSVHVPDENDYGMHEYRYDNNGNLIRDLNKNIDITYNHLNLPTVVDFGNGNRIEWIYSAGGAKLRKTVYENNEIAYFKDYVGGFFYKTVIDSTDGSISKSGLEFIATSEGKAKPNEDGSFSYIYDLKDHLGNVRVSFKESSSGTAEVVQEDHYYPFGMRLAGLSSDSGNDNKFLYNSKELEDDFKLNWYHYGARYYDPQLGRWLQVDPADEFYSPYVYCANNPVNFVDTDGRVATDVSLARAFYYTYLVKGDIDVNYLNIMSLMMLLKHNHKVMGQAFMMEHPEIYPEKEWEEDRNTIENTRISEISSVTFSIVTICAISVSTSFAPSNTITFTHDVLSNIDSISDIIKELGLNDSDDLQKSLGMSMDELSELLSDDFESNLELVNDLLKEVNTDDN